MPRYLVTSALPYANGPIHFGHVAGAYLPADVYVRTLRMQGEDVLFICGTDEFGVAITIQADKQGQAYPEYVAKWREVISSTFEHFSIDFDIFSGTSHCPQHAETAQEFFRSLHANGYVVKKTEEQLFCPQDDMFLADRYVEGTCYVCGHTDARGDECPSCGTWIDQLRLQSPRCKMCGTTPEKRFTTHWHIDLPKLRDEFIGEWIGDHPWKPNVGAFIKNLLEDAPQRAITRDMKWGIPVPADLADGEEGKVLYVWFDAPIGYVSFTKELMEKRGTPDAWRDYWQGDDSRLVHFIGKDNIPFHCMVFPSMLHGVKQDYVLPWQVPANEFYNLEKRKFSTSDGWSIDLEDFFSRHDAEAARFYILSTLPETSDSDFTWDGFRDVLNASLADKIGNLATRVLKFIGKHFGDVIPPIHPEHLEEMDRVMLVESGAIGDPAEHVLEYRFRRAAEQLVSNATVANVFMDSLAPWGLRKTDPARAESVLNTLCEWISWLSRWMVPFMPGKAQEMWAMLGQEGEVSAQPWPGLPSADSWRSLHPGQPLGEVRGLFQKLDEAQVQTEVERMRARAKAPQA